MVRIILILFCCILVHDVFGQETLVEITGEIINAETQEPVPYVHVVNNHLNQGTVSNTQGRFWISMEKTDTLLISAIGFETYAFMLKEQITSIRLEVTIELNTSSMELEAVDVFAFRNEEALKKALLETKVPIQEAKRGIQLQVPGFYYGPKKEVKPSIGSPISFLHSKFSKEVKERKQLAKYERQQNYQKLIRAKYNEAVVIELTGLPKDKVEEFMEFCKLDNSFLGPASEYEIAIAVNRCFTDFKELTPVDSLVDEN
ncbi:carboxypeptidase-like regulatory domain-containing protein [Fulvivirga sp. M361]|uniref:carboxypeptidase-like regulatory domain-containing protein n=1 Tax=Fulvivirga sp. M361 TaxID=2594266 RepID=UPI001626C323|nr:carboxypeptidase-like regulatory domain-containing protein [Fulvivirga sp. M361]